MRQIIHFKNYHHHLCFSGPYTSIYAYAYTYTFSGQLVCKVNLLCMIGQDTLPEELLTFLPECVFAKVLLAYRPLWKIQLGITDLIV